mmetsp:Transcript_28349/g.86991  ORF Transcript_28349/g.86991 Transcript_28349/m.86991 type:complete len:885 (+) Transcript_28349:1-2655(+)
MHFIASRELFAYGEDGETSAESATADESGEEQWQEDIHVAITALPAAVSRNAARVLRARQRSGKLEAVTKVCTCKARKARKDLGSSESSEASSDEVSSTASGDSASDDGSDAAPRRRGDTNWLPRYLPVLDWASNLTCSKVQADVIAGVTVGIMVIPQGMSYANIAGLQYIVGLYSACVPAIVYALLGQSRQLAVGPVAMVSLLMQAGLEGVLTEEQCPEWYRLGGSGQAPPQSTVCPEEYLSVALLTAFVLGVIQVLASLLGLSFLVTFLGHPVVSGFSSGAAIIIGLSQFKYFLGVTIPKSEQVYETVAELIKALPEAHWLTALLGFLWFAFLFITKKLSQRNKKLKMIGPIGPLVSCVVGIFLVWFCKPLREQYDVKYIGEIPSGLMPVTIGKLSFANVAAVVPVAISACLIGFMESIAISKNLATQHGYNLEARQELLALGVSNFVGSMFSCYPVTGSFSRSAVNNTTGAQTQLSGLITALVLLCTLLFLTPCFYYLPMFALAAIVMNSVISLIAYDVAIELFKVKRYDFVLWVVAFIGTLLLGVLKGVALAVIMSLVVVIFESVRPAITILWRVPGTTMYRAIELESRGTFVPNIFIARIGASMYFANASYIKDSILTFIDDISDYTATEYVVLDMSSVYSLDSTAVHTVQDIVHDFRHRGIEVAFVTVGRYVEKVMARADLLKLIGDRWMFSSVHAAVRYCLIHQYHKKEMRSFDNLVPAQVGVARVLSERSGAATSTSKTSRTSRRPRTESYGVSMTHTTEVGFSNETHRSLTVVFIQLERDIPGITDVILSVFGQQDVEAVRREVAGLSHTYFVQDANGNQLDDEVMELLKVELIASIERCADCPFPSDARMLELEQELARAHAKIKELETRLRTH